MGAFFWTPIPFKQYQNASGCSTAFVRPHLDYGDILDGIAGWGKKSNAIYGVKKNKPYFYAINLAKFNFSHMVFKVVSAGYFGQIFQNLHVSICNYGFLSIDGQKKVKNNFLTQLVNFWFLLTWMFGSKFCLSC